MLFNILCSGEPRKGRVAFVDNVFSLEPSFRDSSNDTGAPVADGHSGGESFFKVLYLKLLILEKNQDKIDWEELSRNPNAIHLLEKNLDKIDWSYLSTNPKHMHILEKNLDKIDWEYLSENPNAIDLLEKNQDKINWGDLSENPNAIDLLEKNLDKIDWVYLSRNPNGISILENNQHKIDWSKLSQNKGTYELNYKFLKERMDIIREDLMKAVYHPKRLGYYLELGYDIFDE